MTLRILVTSFICFALMFLVMNPAQAETKGSCIPGAYLVQEGSGTQSLWTFSRDGTIQSASSAQGVFNFSDAQGAWKQTGSREAKATILDFNFDESTPPASIARVDAVLSFSKKCGTLQGTFDLRFFDPETEDPLDPSTDSGDPISDTFTGRRITTK